MSKLLIHDRNGVRVTAESAGWTYVGFETVALSDGDPLERETRGHELCVVVIEGTVDASSEHGEWGDLGGRVDPWSGLPDAVYLPPGTSVTLRPMAVRPRWALCLAPAPTAAPPRGSCPARRSKQETRGYGAQSAYVHPILMGDREAESLLVVRGAYAGRPLVVYPPHKHDRDDPPRGDAA